MNHPRAFTLAELLIATTPFALVAMLSVSILVNGMASAKKIQAELFLHSEGELIMEQLTREIEQNTIDYEAYYARNVQGETGWETQNYGYYGQSFYDPGTGGWDEGPYTSLADYWGVLCSDGTSIYPEDCPTETPNYAHLDLDTGAHPFSGIGSPYTDDETGMNAFCEDSTALCNTLDYAITGELILVSSAGDLRTVFTKELFESTSTEYSLSSVELTGSDSDADGLVDAWVCSSDYTCSTGSVPNPDDLTDTDSGTGTDFMALTPSTISVQDFYVFIAPLEDPYRAFAEEDVQVQPQVTLVMTLTVSEEYGSSFIGETPTITLQRTIPSNVYGEVISYE